MREHFIFVILATLSITVYSDSNFNVFDNLKSSLHLAGKFLTLDQSRGVAELVSETFGKIRKENESGNNGSEDGEPNKGVFSAFFRILGFDADKVGAVAVNAIIFASQLITTSLLNPQPKRSDEKSSTQDQPGKGTPFEWMLDNNEILKIVNHINEPDLPEKVIEHIKERSLEEETGCIQLLICKLSPFFWGMQKALNTTVNPSLKGSKKLLFEYFPTFEEVGERAEHCERSHHFCIQDFL